MYYFTSRKASYKMSECSTLITSVHDRTRYSLWVMARDTSNVVSSDSDEHPGRRAV